MADGKVKAKCNYCSLGLQPQAERVELHIAQVICFILLLICDISANGITQSCIDAPNEAKSKAEILVINRLGRKRGSRPEMSRMIGSLPNASPHALHSRNASVPGARWTLILRLALSIQEVAKANNLLMLAMVTGNIPFAFARNRFFQDF